MAIVILSLLVLFAMAIPGAVIQAVRKRRAEDDIRAIRRAFETDHNL